MADLASIRLRRLPVSLRLCLSFSIAALAIGYLVAAANLYLTYNLTDGVPGLTVNDLRRSFYGNRDNTRLAAKIDGGSMEQFLPRPGDKGKILSWIQDGASEKGYDEVAAPILRANCVRCHNPAGVSSFRPLARYEQVMTVVEVDRGEPVALWARVAHTHIQSIGLIFLALGVIFSFTSLNDRWKSTVVSAAYTSLFVDFGARFLTKYAAGLVYVMVTAGAVMGLSLAVMIVIPLLEMWFKRPAEFDNGPQGQVG